jgi:hypothetical protein
MDYAHYKEAHRLAQEEQRLHEHHRTQARKGSPQNLSTLCHASSDPSKTPENPLPAASATINSAQSSFSSPLSNPSEIVNPEQLSPSSDGEVAAPLLEANPTPAPGSLAGFLLDLSASSVDLSEPSGSPSILSNMQWSSQYRRWRTKLASRMAQRKHTSPS